MLSNPFLIAVVALAVVLAGFAGSTTTHAAEMTEARCAAQGGTWKNVASVGGIPKMDCVGGALIKGMTLEEQVKFATDLTAVSGCVKDHMKGSFTITDGSRAGGYDWPIAPFDSQDSKDLALVNKEVSCVDLFLNTVEAAGYGLAYGPVFDAIGYTFKGHQGDGDRYEGDPNPRERSVKFYNLMMTRVGAKGLGSLCSDSSTDPTTCSPPTGAMKYLIAWKGLNAGTCKPKDRGLYDSASQGTKDSIQKGVKTLDVGTKKLTIDLKVPVLKEDGTLEDHIYQVAYGNEGDKSPTTKQKTYGGFEPTCVDLVNDLNKFAKAYALYMNDHPAELASVKPTPTDDPDKTPEDGQAVSSCNIDGIGWILCPVLTAGANLADAAYGFLADNFLRVNTGLLGTDPNTKYVDSDGRETNVSNGTFVAWGIMRNIANVAFIIVFLIIVASQLSNVAVSNYGVKKMLPRLMIGAVLVNLSFYICQAVVDISNIAGYGLKEILDGVSNQVASAGVTGIDASAKGDEGGHLGGILTLVIVGGVVAWMNLGAIGLAIVAGVVVLLTVFVVLVVRQTLVVLLIVLAPLAFVAYLLPNTEPLFKKWRKMLVAMLLLFPVIGLLYGASKLASTVLLQVAGQDVALQVAAYMALVLPLIAIVPLLKGSLNAIPAIGNAIQKFGQRGSSMAQGGAKRGASAYKNSDWNKYRSGLAAERNARIRAGKFEGRGGKLNPRNWRSAANRAINNSAAFDTLTGGFGSRRKKSDAKWEGKEISEKAEAMAGYLDENGLPFDPQQLFDEKFAHQQRVYANPRSSEKAKRDARIDLAAAQSHLIRSNGQAGSEYARDRLAAARGGGSFAAPSTTPLSNPSANAGGLGGGQSQTPSGTGAPATAVAGAAATSRAQERAQASQPGTSAVAPGTPPVSTRLQDAATSIHRDNQTMASSAGETQLTREQIKNMGQEHVEAFANKNGGVDLLSEGNLLRIANAHRGTDVGQQARQELIARGVIKETPKRDDRTIPKQ